MTLLLTYATRTGELANDGGIGALSLRMAFLTTVEATTGLGGLGAVGLGMAI